MPTPSRGMELYPSKMNNYAEDCILHLKLILLPPLSYTYPPKEYPYNSFKYNYILVSDKKLVSWEVIEFFKCQIS